MQIDQAQRYSVGDFRTLFSSSHERDVVKACGSLL